MWVRIQVQMQVRLEEMVSNGASASPVTNTPSSTGAEVLRVYLGKCFQHKNDRIEFVTRNHARVFRWSIMLRREAL